MGQKFIRLLITAVFLAVCLCACRTETDKAARLFDEGLAAMDKEDYNKAVDLFTEVIKEDPDMAVAYNNRALAFIQVGNLYLAREDLLLALEIEETAEYYNNLAQIDIKESKLRDAIDHFTSAIELDSRVPEYYSGRASAYQQLDYDEKAISDYTQAIALGQKDQILYNNRGIAYMDVGEYAKAAADFTTALKGDSVDKTVVLQNRAESYLRAKEFDAAMEDYQALIDMGISPNEYRNIIGRILIDQGKYDEASKVLALIDKDQRDADTILLLADLNFQTEDYPAALGYYTELVDLKKDALSFGLRAECYLRLYDTEAALKDLDKAIELDPEYGWAYYTRGNIYLDQGDYKKAEEDLAKAADLAYEEEAAS